MKTTFTSASLNVEPRCHYCFMIQYLIHASICTNTVLQNGKLFSIQKILHAEGLLTTHRCQMSYVYVNIKIQLDIYL